MSYIYNTNAKKKATNVTINSDLLEKVKRYNINISKSFEEHLAELLKRKVEQEWLEENREAIEEFNKRVEEKGVFSDAFRRF